MDRKSIDELIVLHELIQSAKKRFDWFFNVSDMGIYIAYSKFKEWFPCSKEMLPISITDKYIQHRADYMGVRFVALERRDRK